MSAGEVWDEGRRRVTVETPSCCVSKPRNSLSEVSYGGEEGMREGQREESGKWVDYREAERHTFTHTHSTSVPPSLPPFLPPHPDDVGDAKHGCRLYQVGKVGRVAGGGVLSVAVEGEGGKVLRVGIANGLLGGGFDLRRREGWRER